MALKVFGKIRSCQEKENWLITDIEPHVMIKIKSVFEYMPKLEFDTFKVRINEENSRDLLWFNQRYPFSMSAEDKKLMSEMSEKHIRDVNEAEEILAPNRKSSEVFLKDGKSLRDYQSTFVDLFRIKKKMVLGDTLGLGKTISAIGVIVDQKVPVIVVCQSHLTKQWKDQIESFTNLSAHIAKTTKPYTIKEKIDVLIIPYSKMQGWANALSAGDFSGFFRGIIFDEIQELRRDESAKYAASTNVSKKMDFVLGLTGTPVYNYGIEAYNIFDVVKPGCLSTRNNFIREWCRGGETGSVKDPKALGSYLRSNHIFLRRTWDDVNIKMESANRIIVPVDTESKEIEKIEERAKILATKIFSGSFVERGEAARQFDLMLRHATGVAKARSVADMIHILMNSEEKILLAGWHRDVYDIWMRELAEFKPVLYTGSESPAEKQKSKEAFVNGDSRLMIISLRSGVGLDGLQHVARTVVIGELDWSPAVHDQVIGRLSRDGQAKDVHAYFCVANDGSDPAMVSLAGIKSSQASGITDPFASTTENKSDDGRIKEMAKMYLGGKVGDNEG